MGGCGRRCTVLGACMHAVCGVSALVETCNVGCRPFSVRQSTEAASGGIPLYTSDPNRVDIQVAPIELRGATIQPHANHRRSCAPVCDVNQPLSSMTRPLHFSFSDLWCVATRRGCGKGDTSRNGSRNQPKARAQALLRVGNSPLLSWCPTATSVSAMHAIARLAATPLLIFSAVPQQPAHASLYKQHRPYGPYYYSTSILQTTHVVSHSTHDQDCLGGHSSTKGPTSHARKLICQLPI